MPTVLGIQYSTNSNGVTNTTLHVTDDFNGYYNNPAAGRHCIGKKVETIYAGAYDCTNIKVGSEIEILYDKAVTTSKGVFQPIKRIDVLSK